MLSSKLLRSALPLAVFSAVAAACAIERPNATEGGIHPQGWADKNSPDFHATYLKDQYQANGRFPLADCRACHGDDYLGGAVGVSCAQANCHTQGGPEQCGTCHDGKTPPKPVSGGHPAHTDKYDCSACHHVPKSAREPEHPDGKVEVYLTGIAAEGGLAARWDPSQRRCVNVYCHGGTSPTGGTSPVWDKPVTPAPCDTCHAAPPATHARFHVAAAPDGCKKCHPGHDTPEHLDGKIEYIEPGCHGCHGQDDSGAPPPALDGSTDPSSVGVGAHQAHLDPNFPGRIGKAVDCNVCHEVPASMLSAGHIDQSAPADVRLFEGSYDPASHTCTVSCHFDRQPGPTWTDASGAALKCDACHGFPPVKTRAGVPHPQVQPSLDVCKTCHHYDPTTHIDGKVDFLQ